MNEHIKKLFDKALDQAVPETWTQLSHEQLIKLSEVFAELIVQECAEFVSNDRQNDEYGVFVSNRIKEHFGVEE
jgi:hypothetical protein